MDPIHPILPVPPNIPPVTEAPRVGKIDRDQRRERGDEDGERESKRQTPAGKSAADDGQPAEGEPRRHIDVTA